MKRCASIWPGKTGFNSFVTWLAYSFCDSWEIRVKFCPSCGQKSDFESAKYCFNCGEKLSGDIYSLIESYFHGGYRYEAIFGLLSKFHGINIHVRTLKRKLQEMDLKRRYNSFDIDRVRETTRCKELGN